MKKNKKGEVAFASSLVNFCKNFCFKSHQFLQKPKRREFSFGFIVEAHSDEQSLDRSLVLTYFVEQPGVHGECSVS